ncbi:MAG: hypothetical protein GY694_04270 [Gammaproteobacteria bacterium]|nr:hypothetical protein [Gammaproteobacteria bacterium]
MISPSHQHQLHETSTNNTGLTGSGHLFANALSRLNSKLGPALKHTLEKLIILLIPVPVLMLIKGIEGIIERESPDSLASLGTVSSGFFNFLEMHSLIIAGAFGVTFIVWFLTRNIWSNSDSEYTDDDYDDFVTKELMNKK